MTQASQPMVPGDPDPGAMIRLTHYLREHEAVLVQNVLEREGIPARVLGLSSTGGLGLTRLASEGWSVHIRMGDRPRAIGVLNEIWSDIARGVGHAADAEIEGEPDADPALDDDSDHARLRRLAVDSQGRCVQCGYDMRGIVRTRTVCPECGTDLAAIGRLAIIAPLPEHGFAHAAGVFVGWVVLLAFVTALISGVLALLGVL